VVKVRFKPGVQEVADTMLRDEVIPGAKKTEGFVAGYWMHAEDGAGLSVELFDSLANAQAELGRRQTSAPAEAPWRSSASTSSRSWDRAELSGFAVPAGGLRRAGRSSRRRRRRQIVLVRRRSASRERDPRLIAAPRRPKTWTMPSWAQTPRSTSQEPRSSKVVSRWHRREGHGEEPFAATIGPPKKLRGLQPRGCTREVRRRGRNGSILRFGHRRCPPGDSCCRQTTSGERRPRIADARATRSARSAAHGLVTASGEPPFPRHVARPTLAVQAETRTTTGNSDDVG
jgi:hypothetical protein